MNPHVNVETVIGLPQVEQALATVFGVKSAGLPALRGRIQHLRRLGLTPPSGRGQVIQYDFGWCARWYLALLLTIRLGRDPVQAVRFIKENWGRPFRKDLAAAEARVDANKAGLGDLVEVARHVEQPDLHVILTFDADGGLPVVGHTRVRGMPSFAAFLADGPGRIVTILDLTVHLKQLDAAPASSKDEVGPDRKRA